MKKETKNIIEIKNLNVIYNKGKPNQVRALDGVSLEFEPEEWVIIFGPSGCGKSTLLNSIAGLETPTGGKVKVFGRDIYSLGSDEKAEHRRSFVGMVFQSFHLINSLKVIDNVCLPQVFFGQDLEKRREMAKIYLERFGIADQAEKYPADISGGQRQKVSIARALINRPEVILADEPVGNLDSKSTYNVMAILKELNRVDKKTIIMVTHDRHHLSYADRIVHVKDGKVIKVEVIKKRKRSLGDDLEDEKIVSKTREVKIPNDLRLLMKSFKDMSSTKTGQLLEPFKVKQTFAHLMLPVTNYQIERTQDLMRRYFMGTLRRDHFLNQLDKSIEEGGVGWDKRAAKRFVEDVATLYSEAQKIDYSKPLKSAIRLVKFFLDKYPVRLTEYKMNVMRSGIEARLNSEISKDELQDVLSRSVDKEGVGLNRKTAQKIARELELLVLIRYSG